MAIVSFGVSVTGIRGKLGGAVFSANGTSDYVRPLYKSANPRTPAQSANRSRLAFLPTEWRSLTNGQRADWDSFAALPAQARTNSLGQTYYCSGWNWFVLINQRLQYAGQAVRLTYPLKPRPAAPSINAFEFLEVAGAPRARLTYPPAEFTPAETIFLDLAYIPGAGRTVQYGSYPVMASTPNPGPSPFSFAPQFTNHFGNPQLGARAFVRVSKQTDDGLRSSPWTDFQDYS